MKLIMKLSQRVAGVLLVTTAVAGGLTLGAAASAGTPTAARETSQAALQGRAVAQAATDRARADLAARRSADLAARRSASLAARHQAYLASLARLDAARARQRVLVAAAERADAARRAPGTAGSTTSSTTSSTTAGAEHPAESDAQRAQRIYASFHYDLGRLGYRIVFRPYAKGLLGLTDSGTHTVTVYVRSTESDLVLAHSIAHEMGHALDFARGSDAKRQLYLSVRQLQAGLLDWFGCNRCTDYSTAAGDWAEVFAQWLAGPGDFRSQLGAAPSTAELGQLSPLFAL